MCSMNFNTPNDTLKKAFGNDILKQEGERTTAPHLLNSKKFLLELCKYYMEFLETDFKEGRPPGRKVCFQRNNMVTDIALSKYPRLNSLTLELINSNFKKNIFTDITKKDFTIKIPEKNLQQTSNSVNINTTLKKSKFLELIVNFIEQLNICNKDNIINDIKNKTQNMKAPELASFSTNYVITCFYDELYDLWKNMQILDKQDFYLYFLDIRDENYIYPIFYIPISIERTTKGTFSFEFDPVFLINKKSIQYISEKFAKEQNKDWKIDLPPRHIYLSNFENNNELIKYLQGILNEICDFLGLKPLAINNPEPACVSNQKIRLTNNCYLSIFDKSDEALLNDYEELLNLIISDNEVLDKMKLEDFIQNPIVRLGKKDNTFAGIFKQINYDKIKNRFNSYKRHKNQIDKEIENILETIKKNINTEIETSLLLDPQNIKHLLLYEKTFENLWKNLLDLDELEALDGSTDLIIKLWYTSKKLNENYTYLFKHSLINFMPHVTTITELKSCILLLVKDLENVQKKMVEEYSSLLLSKEITKENLIYLENSLKKIDDLKKPIFGYLFSKNSVKSIELEFKKRFFLSSVDSIVKNKKILLKELQLYKYCDDLNEKWANIGLNTFLILGENDFENVIANANQIVSMIDDILKIKELIPSNFNLLGLNYLDINNILGGNFIKIQENEIVNFGKYLRTYFKILLEGTVLSYDNFMENRRNLENRLVFKMTHILDESVVSFRENYKGDAEELKKIIRAKKKIPKYYLEKLIEAFPCLIFGIREIGEFIPLEPNLFDIVIIDEASQVSIAQAFPAILRAKKVVILGDSKQYSNVKSHNAATAVNNFLFNRVKNSFMQYISILNESEKDMLKDKVDNFNIKNSILDFMRNLSNYQCSLKKHFRCYLEIIGYSNETFYQKSLQVMKIRGKSIRDVIQFHCVDADDKQEKLKNTNSAEVDYILNELRRLKNESFKGTIAIITPFTNQQKLISSKVYDSENWQFYQNEFKLKVMTFDSCPGDEKDVIYYSMVEKPNEDNLKYIFPIKFSNLDDEEDGNLKAQRLNVGLSRAKESIRFVLSKNPDKIKFGRGIK